MSDSAIDIRGRSPEDWPDLVSLDLPTLPHLNAEHVPGWAGTYAKALSAATETPDELSAAMVLAATATAAARRIQVEVKPGYVEPVNLWIAAALPPGNRKSAVQSAATSPIIGWEREEAARVAPEIAQLESERSVLEMRAKDLRTQASKCEDKSQLAAMAREAGEIDANLPEVPRLPQLWTSDATPERLGILLAEHGERMAWMSSEGGVFDLLAGRYSGGIPNLDLTLKAWSGDSERVDRKGRAPIHLDRPLLSIGLSPQPEMLRGLASRPGFRGRGLLGRFLYLLPTSPLGWRTLNTEPVPDSARLGYAAGLNAILNWPAAFDHEGRATLHTLHLSKDARQDWYEFSQLVEASMRPGGDFQHATDWAGKCPGQAIRVAGVLHGIRHAHGEPWAHEISGDTMNAALELMAVISKHSLAAFDLMGADDGIAAARRIWEWIAEGYVRRFTVREAHIALRSYFPRAKDVRNALDILEERGYLRVLDLPSSSSGGRPPSPIVQVRPELAGARP
ncbi:YfjI family protein [Salinisphaera sp. SWV1]|uniref:YfjI family protein n=1 Tax=Salinisphaera sp. SWV1 TaxID=3454139 RepID=UPI003F865083